MAIIKRNGKKLIDSHGFRFAVLLLAAVVGYCLSKWGFPWLDCWLNFSDKVGHYLEPVLFGLPVFICLWYFRTYDTQQQIQQGNFVAGMDKLAQDDHPAVIAVGVKILLRVSAKTDSFDDEIRDAFINRLKKQTTIPDLSELRASLAKNPNDISAASAIASKIPPRFTYAQYILQWLIAKQEHYAGKPDLRGMRCDYQEFTIHGLHLVKILPTLDEVEGEGYTPNFHGLPVFGVRWGVSFVESDCATLNFDGVAPEIFLITNAINTRKDGKDWKQPSDTFV